MHAGVHMRRPYWMVACGSHPGQAAMTTRPIPPSTPHGTAQERQTGALVSGMALLWARQHTHTATQAMFPFLSVPTACRDQPEAYCGLFLLQTTRKCFKRRFLAHLDHPTLHAARICSARAW